MLSLLLVSSPLQSSPSHSIWTRWNGRTVKALLNIQTFSTAKWRTTITTSRAQTTSSASHTTPVWTREHPPRVTKTVEALYVFSVTEFFFSAFSFRGSDWRRQNSETGVHHLFAARLPVSVSSVFAIFSQSDFMMRLDSTSTLKKAPSQTIFSQCFFFLVVTKAEGGLLLGMTSVDSAAAAVLSTSGWNIHVKRGSENSTEGFSRRKICFRFSQNWLGQEFG